MSASIGGAVCSHNEWDPLEEAIVGVVDQAAVPQLDRSLAGCLPAPGLDLCGAAGGSRFPVEMIDAARRELDDLVALLFREGVEVRRPELLAHDRPFATPDWRSAGGLYAAMPRDVLLVVGTEIIEAPMAWRCRHFEVNAYRELLKEYFRRGARWTAAPRPTLVDAQYSTEVWGHGDPGVQKYTVTEFEPTFDAADFVRCGRDLFVQQSNVTNRFGIEWLRQHLGETYNVHVVNVCDPHPMHIDATMLPLAPGKLLVNPERLPRIPALFKDWQILQAPEPAVRTDFPMCSAWVSMNVLSLDQRRVLVEQEERPMIAALESWGFEPIPCPFRAFNAFGGSFHCAVLDVRRRGSLGSYF